MEFKIGDIVEVRVYPLDHTLSNALQSVGMITGYEVHYKGEKCEQYMYFVNGSFEGPWRLKLKD